jgi:filamentous hemagglutinin family protein
MNRKRYVIVYSQRLGIWIAVAQTQINGRDREQRLKRRVGARLVRGALVRWSLGMALARSCVAQVQALPEATLPQGAQVVAGQMAVQATGQLLTIEQHSTAGIVNWNQFSIGAAAAVRVNQPSAQSVHLDRVVGVSPSQILGRYSSNGQLFLINPNGIVFGSSGSVVASSFTASTFDVS